MYRAMQWCNVTRQFSLRASGGIVDSTVKLGIARFLIPVEMLMMGSALCVTIPSLENRVDLLHRVSRGSFHTWWHCRMRTYELFCFDEY